MEHEFMRKVGIIATVFLFFVLSLMTLKPGVTGFFLFEGQNVSQLGVGMITMAIILFIFFFINKGSTKEVMKNIIGAIAIYVGIYTVTRIVPSLDLIIAVLSLTFGLMAIIWVWRAKNSFSKGSSLKDFSAAFFACLISILLFSLLDNALTIFELGGVWLYAKYALMTIAYINFVYAAYKMRNLGTTFGFSEQSIRVRKALDAKMKKIR